MASAILTKTNITSPNGNFHWTVDTFYRAVEADVFDEPNRLELVNGALWEKEPMNARHASLTRRITRLLRRLLEPALLVIEEKPLHLSTDGEPVPDVYVVIGSEEDYEERHPTNAETRLVIEVADSSVERDTGEKARLYARAGIADYWVSLVGLRQLWVYRNPTENGYDEPLQLNEVDTIKPLAAPDVELFVRDLLTPATSTNNVSTDA